MMPHTRFADWIAKLVFATALIFSSGIAILSVLLGSLTVFFTLGLVRAVAESARMTRTGPLSPPHIHQPPRA